MAGKAGVKEEFTPKYGEWAFLLGVLLALVIGLFSTELGANGIYVLGLLVLLGFVVGLLNISEKETTAFLIATIALLGVAASWQPVGVLLGSIGGGYGALIAGKIGGILSALVSFVAPAALVVSLKLIYELASK
ncbi:MAG: hypothetical protein QXT45_03050 [Candidatus Bilamarchaeaceae archaeon]